MSATRIIFLPSGENEPLALLELDKAGPPSSNETSDAHRTMLVIPGADVATFWLKLPAQRSADPLLKSAKMQLEEKLAAPLDTVHIALGKVEEDGLRPVCVIDRARMRAHLVRAAGAGFIADSALPDHLLLSVPIGESVTVAHFDGMQAARGRDLAFTAEPELARLILGDRPIEHIDAQADHVVMFANAAAAPPVDLLQFEFTPKRKLAFQIRQFQRAAMLAGVLLLSPLLLWTAEITRHEFGAILLNGRANEIARSVSISDSDNDVPALRGFVANIEDSDRFLAATAALFDAVATIHGARLDAFSYRRDGDIRATLIHEQPEDLSVLHDLLERSGFTFREDGTDRRNAELSTPFSLGLRS